MHIPFFFNLVRKFDHWPFSRTFIFRRLCALAALFTAVPENVILCSGFRSRQTTLQKRFCEYTSHNPMGLHGPLQG
jgi:hypothetical protein